MKLLHWFNACVEKKEVAMQTIGGRLPSFVTPNKLSFLRLILVFPFIWVLIDRKFLLGFFFFMIAVLLDLLDGPLARVRKTSSGLGALLDPIADKILMVTALLLLQFSFSPAPLPDPLLFAILILEGVHVLLPVFHQLIRLQFRIRSLYAAANIFGKIKFTLQSIGGVAMFLLPVHASFGIVATGFFSLSLLFSLLSIGRHVMTAFRS